MHFGLPIADFGATPLCWRVSEAARTQEGAATERRGYTKQRVLLGVKREDRDCKSVLRREGEGGRMAATASMRGASQKRLYNGPGSRDWQSVLWGEAMLQHIALRARGGVT